MTYRFQSSWRRYLGLHDCEVANGSLGCGDSVFEDTCEALGRLWIKRLHLSATIK